MAKIGQLKQFIKKNGGAEPDGDARESFRKLVRDQAEQKRYPIPEKEQQRWQGDK